MNQVGHDILERNTGAAVLNMGQSPIESKRRASGLDDDAADSAAMPIGSVNIDLDTLMDYAPGYGFSFEPEADPVYTHALPRFIEMLKRLDIPVTLFVIGRDAEKPAHAVVLKNAFENGHEPGNHTMNHPRRLSKLTKAALRDEIVQAHEAIASVANRRPVGFRAPCYDLHRSTIDVLHELEYTYDSSVHPTILGPAVDAVVFLKSHGKSREWRPGTYFHSLAPIRPYRAKDHRAWKRSSAGKLIELPLSAVPRTRMPFYGTWAHATKLRTFDRSLKAIRSAGSILNFHFHAIELLDLNDPGVDSRFRVHPGLDQPLSERTAAVEYMLTQMQQAYRLVTLADYAEKASALV